MSHQLSDQGQHSADINSTTHPHAIDGANKDDYLADTSSTLAHLRAIDTAWPVGKGGGGGDLKDVDYGGGKVQWQGVIRLRDTSLWAHTSVTPDLLALAV